MRNMVSFRAARVDAKKGTEAFIAGVRSAQKNASVPFFGEVAWPAQSSGA